MCMDPAMAHITFMMCSACTTRALSVMHLTWTGVVGGLKSCHNHIPRRHREHREGLQREGNGKEMKPTEGALAGHIDLAQMGCSPQIGAGSRDDGRNKAVQGHLPPPKGLALGTKGFTQP